MKTITRSSIYLPLAALILAAAIPAAAQQVPFKGAFLGSDIVSGEGPCAATICTTATGTGTLLGQFALTQQITVNFANFTETGSAQWIAANGDSIYTTIAGSGYFLASGLIRITEIHTVTGGTGRFAGAQGSFTVDRLASPTAFITFGSFHGTISSPGAAH